MKLDVNEPLYIVELGAGSGKFSYYMLKALEEMKDICDFPIGSFLSSPSHHHYHLTTTELY